MSERSRQMATGAARVEEFETPVLLLDIDVLERNIRKMGDYFRGKKASLRPHTKVHKSPWLAQKQVSAGATGITCAKLAEAEIMAQGGIGDILIANEVVGEDKVSRLARLAKWCKVSVAVDSAENARQISSFATKESAVVRVLVDMNLSGSVRGILDRTGVQDAEGAVDLAKTIASLPGLRLGGLIGYEGSLSAFPTPDKKREACELALSLLVQAGEKVQANGLDVETISCGGTLSYRIAAEFPGVTEVQAGGYVFMDGGYRTNGVDFETSLTLLTRVVSSPRPDKIIIDAGYKAVSAESGLPEVKDHPELKVVSLNAEHGHVLADGADSSVRSIGRRLELLPSHLDTTTCLHDQYYLVKGGEIFSSLPVAGRGKLQ